MPRAAASNCKPQSAFAYHILFVVLFFRGETEAGIAAAEKAIALNPYDIADAAPTMAAG